MKISRVFAQPDPSKVREFADDVRDGKFVLPIGRRLPLRQVAEAHVLAETGGVGKIILLVSVHSRSALSAVPAGQKAAIPASKLLKRVAVVEPQVHDRRNVSPQRNYPERNRA